MYAGFKGGTGVNYHLINRTATDVVYFEVGDRSTGDTVSYPIDDIQVVMGSDGKWQFAHKDSTSY